MISVAIVGPDGAGKTTVARRLEDALGIPTVYLYMGVSLESSNKVLPTTRLLLWLRRGRSSSDDDTPRTFGHQSSGGGGGARKRVKASLRASFRLGNRVAEESYRAVLAAWHRNRGRIVLFDRHVFADFYSTDIDSRGRMPLSRRLHGLFLRHVYPKPDLLIYLDAPADLLYARKGEADPETLEAMRRNYQRVAEAGLAYAAVDASQSLDAVVDETAELIRHFARHGTLRTSADS